MITLATRSAQRVIVTAGIATLPMDLPRGSWQRAGSESNATGADQHQRATADHLTDGTRRHRKSPRFNTAHHSAPLHPKEFILGPEAKVVQQALGLNSSDNHDATHKLQIAVVPLTVHAPAGFGKSSLLTALETTWQRQTTNERVIHIAAADFARAYANSLKMDDVPRFLQRFLRVDLLLIDDLDNLARKSGAQRQLGLIIEHRQRHNRPTVFTASQPLRLLNLSERLTSRLASGLVLPLELPSIVTRERLIQDLTEQLQLRMTPPARRRLRDHEPMTVPRLMGLVNQLWLEQQTGSGPAHHSRTDLVTTEQDIETCPVIDLDRVRQLLSEVVDEPASASDVIRATAHFFGLKNANLTGTSRRKMDVLARSIAMYLLREHNQLSFQQIGSKFGNRDHTTVMHAYKKIAAQLGQDNPTRHALNEIRRHLQTKQRTVENVSTKRQQNSRVRTT